MKQVIHILLVGFALLLLLNCQEEIERIPVAPFIPLDSNGYVWYYEEYQGGNLVVQEYYDFRADQRFEIKERVVDILGNITENIYRGSFIMVPSYCLMYLYMDYINKAGTEALFTEMESREFTYYYDGSVFVRNGFCQIDNTEKTPPTPLEDKKIVPFNINKGYTFVKEVIQDRKQTVPVLLSSTTPEDYKFEDFDSYMPLTVFVSTFRPIVYPILDHENIEEYQEVGYWRRIDNIYRYIDGRGCESRTNYWINSENSQFFIFGYPEPFEYTQGSISRNHIYTALPPCENHSVYAYELKYEEHPDNHTSWEWDRGYVKLDGKYSYLQMQENQMYFINSIDGTSRVYHPRSKSTLDF
jgi:hypothetical protein